VCYSLPSLIPNERERRVQERRLLSSLWKGFNIKLEKDKTYLISFMDKNQPDYTWFVGKADFSDLFDWCVTHLKSEDDDASCCDNLFRGQYYGSRGEGVEREGSQYPNSFGE